MTGKQIVEKRSSLLIFFKNARHETNVWVHGRAVVANASCACSQLAVEYVEDYPSRACELHDGIAWTEVVMHNFVFQKLHNRAVLMDNTFWSPGRAAGIADEERVVEGNALEFELFRR